VGIALAASSPGAAASASAIEGTSLVIVGAAPASLEDVGLQVAVCAHSEEAGPPHAQAAMLLR
jgi:hypothetical protein